MEEHQETAGVREGGQGWGVGARDRGGIRDSQVNFDMMFYQIVISSYSQFHT